MLNSGSASIKSGGVTATSKVVDVLLLLVATVEHGVPLMQPKWDQPLGLPALQHMRSFVTKIRLTTSILSLISHNR